MLDCFWLVGWVDLWKRTRGCLDAPWMYLDSGDGGLMPRCLDGVCLEGIMQIAEVSRNSE